MGEEANDIRSAYGHDVGRVGNRTRLWKRGLSIALSIYGCRALVKLISRVLRHDPARVGITLDAAGWVGVTDLVAALNRAGFPCTRAELEEVVRTSDKQRFAIDVATDRIRANQGHSVRIALDLPDAVPPPGCPPAGVTSCWPWPRATCIGPATGSLARRTDCGSSITCRPLPVAPRRRPGHSP